MNERIKQIAEQAGLCFVDYDGTLTNHFENFANMDTEVKKFAELIVRECARIQLARSFERHGYDKYEDASAILQHFGVDR